MGIFCTVKIFITVFVILLQGVFAFLNITDMQNLMFCSVRILQMTVLLLILVSLGTLSLAYHWKQANASHVVPRKTANAKVLKLLLISFSSCPKHCPLAVQDPFSLVTNKVNMTF